MTLSALGDGKPERTFEIELADAEPDWWSPLDISVWRGKTLIVTVDKMRDDSRGLAQVAQGDATPGMGNLYREVLRPQFHFSARRGWLNDPNGLAFYHGEYHLFFQHCPFSWSHAPNFWGHAVSRDLVHWQELGEALAPDEAGGIWSGSAVVDWKITSGFGKDGQPPLVLIYTAGGETQRLAYSTDGRTFTKWAGNPAAKKITGGNRDPKVFWHEPTQRWVMALYVEKERHHTIHFLTSPNLREWTLASVTDAGRTAATSFSSVPTFLNCRSMAMRKTRAGFSARPIRNTRSALSTDRNSPPKRRSCAAIAAGNRMRDLTSIGITTRPRPSATSRTDAACKSAGSKP